MGITANLLSVTKYKESVQLDYTNITTSLEQYIDIPYNLPYKQVDYSGNILEWQMKCF